MVTPYTATLLRTGVSVPGRINDDDIAALRERADLAFIAADYTSLKRAGSRLKGLCPFHDERTPSFVVDPARGLFHCFGCNAGGDVYAFLQKVEALTFPEAVERVARIVGFDLRYEELTPGQRKVLGRRTRLAEAASAAAGFYRRCLADDGGAAARAYLAQRGVGAEAVERFQLGWAADQWDGLTRHLLAEGFQPKELVDAGLATQGRQGPIDRFRGRVIFPIFDATGRDVVAFGGRLVPGLTVQTAPRDAPAPKYINSPESELYKKSRTLYGLNWARTEIQRAEAVLVVEGYMDVIALHLAGATNAVATCGTALTADHFRQLEKFAGRVVLALDADDAGYAAADRARELAVDVGIRDVSVLPLPAGKDPADLAAGGRDAVSEALARTQTAVEFQIRHLLRVGDRATPEGQIAAYRETFPLLAKLGDRFLRFSYIRDVVAPAVRLSADRIERELDDYLRSKGAATPSARTDRAAPAVPGDVAAGIPRDPQLLLERDVLRVALQTPELLGESWKLVSTEDFRAPMSRQLFSAIAEAPAGDLDAVLGGLPDDDMRARVRALAMSDPTVEADPGHVAELVARLRAAALHRDIQAVEEQMATLNEQLGTDERRALAARHLELVQRRQEVLKGGDR